MKKIKKGLFITLVLAALTCGGGALGVLQTTTPNRLITANAAELGEITIYTHSGNNSWLSSSNRILFKLPSSVSSGTYTMNRGTISLVRNGNTYVRDESTEFTIQTFGAEGDAYIEVWHFDSDLPEGAYAHAAGDCFLIDATFSNGADSFYVDAKIIINSTMMGDMYVEAPAIDAGHGNYTESWTNYGGGNYYAQMHITSNANIPAGTYKQVNTDAITLTRNGTVYDLPVGDYLTVGNDNGGVQQIEFMLWPIGNVMGISYTVQAGDVFTVDGQFTNGTVTFEIQKTEIEYLEGQAYTYSVIPVYTVTYLDADGNEADVVEAKHNTTLAQPQTPIKGEEVFEGWYNGETKWDFATAVTSDLTLMPRFRAVTHVDAGYGRYTPIWDNSWVGKYYPQMSIVANASIPAGTYRQVDEDALTLTREGNTYNLPITDSLIVGSANNGTQQIDFNNTWMWGQSHLLNTTYTETAGDVITVDGLFQNADGTVVFEMQRTEITFLPDKACAHSVIPVYTVTYLDDGGNVVERVNARHNTALAQPADAIKTESGWIHEFIGWYNGEERWDFSTAITSNLTLKPKFNSYVDAGKGYTADALWAGISYYFALPNNEIMVGSFLRPTAETCMQITRNGDTTSIGQIERDTLYKNDALLYVVQTWTLDDWKTLQDGDVLTLQGAWTDGTTEFYIQPTKIRVSDSGTTNDQGAKLFYSTVIEERTVHFTVDGETYTTQTVLDGEKLSEPTAPIKAEDNRYAYVFAGWYNGEKPWNFTSDTVWGEMTLTAVFEAVKKETIDAGYGYNENITTKDSGFYFKMYENAVPYGGSWNVGYKPTTTDAILRVRDGVTTNVGNTSAETIVKYGATHYYVEAWTVGGWQDGDVFIFSGEFKNESNGTTFLIRDTYVQINVNSDGSHTDVVLNPTITFVDANGGLLSRETIAYNARISQPAFTPTKEADEVYRYAFTGWYVGETKWNFTSDIPSGDITLSPKFAAVAKYKEVYVENAKASETVDADGVYFYADANEAAYNADGRLRYIPVTADAVKRIDEDGTVTNVGNTDAETIVKYGETSYYIEGWALGGFIDGATYVLNGTFKNVTNQTLLAFDNVRITIDIDDLDGSIHSTISRSIFSMTVGASIRMNEGSMGIRFEAELGDSYDEEASYYMMIVPKSYLTAFNITGNYYESLYSALYSAGLSTYIGAMQCQPFQYTAEEAAKYDKVVTSWYVRGSLTNIQYHNMNTEFFAIAYKMKDGVYTYAKFNEGDNVRSIADVASKALNATDMYTDEQKIILNRLVDRALKEGAGVAEDAPYVGETVSISATELVGYPVATQLTLNGIPDDADVYVAWVSSNPSVVAVDEYGNVLGVSSGTATITANYRGVSYTCEVTNVACAKPSLIKDGSIVSWVRVANVAEYGITVCDEYGVQVYAGTVKDTCVDLTKLGLSKDTQYELSVTALYNGNQTAAAKTTFVYDDYALAYVQPKDNALDLSVGVWNGAYHFTETEKVEEIAKAGINLIIGINFGWHASMEDVMAVLDVAYANGVSMIIDLREISNGVSVAWDGSLTGTQNATNGINREGYIMHPTIVGVLACEEPTVDKMSELTAVQTKFDGEKEEVGRGDLIFFVNLFGASSSADLANDTCYDYAREYVNAFTNTVDTAVYAFNEYGILSKDGAKYIRKSYYTSFDAIAKAAKDSGKEFWYTLLSAACAAEDEGGYAYSEPTEEELRWQMAVGMTFGAKNLTHYTYTSYEDGDSTMVEYGTWNTTELFDRIKKINAEYENWDNVYNSFVWQGYAALDFGETENDLTNRKANAMMLNLANGGAVNAIGGLSAVNMSTATDTDGANNAKDLLVGLFADANGNKAFMLTNAGSATDSAGTGGTYNKYHGNLSYSMVDVDVTLTFDAGYAGVIVIDQGVRTYHALINNKLSLTVGAWEGVFVIPVKAQTQLSGVTGLVWDNNNVLTWNGVVGANAYEVVITRNGVNYLSTTVTDTELNLGDKVLGDYVVNVYAKNDGKAITATGAMLHYTIAL